METRERVQVSMIVSAEIKTMIIEVAERHGCSFSEAAEALLRRAITVNDLLKRLNRLNRSEYDWVKL